LRGETAAQLFLVANPRIANQAEDLTVPECFPVLMGTKPCMRMYFYTGDCILLSTDFAIFFRPLPREAEDKGPRAPCKIRSTDAKRSGFFCAGDVTYRLGQYHGSYGNALPDFGLQERAPQAIAEQRLCVLHFHALAGSKLRGDAPGDGPRERSPGSPAGNHALHHGKWGTVARVATSGLHLTDDLKARILSTFLTLMNLRENLDRSNMRSSFGRSSHPLR